MKVRRIRQWYAECGNDGKGMRGDERALRPSSCRTNVNGEPLKQRILLNRRVGIRELPVALQLSIGTVLHDISHEGLGYRKVRARMISRYLTDKHKNRRFDFLELRHPRCICNNEVKYNEDQNTTKFIS